MVKRDKLYTVNKWNKPLFMEETVPLLTGKRGNIFFGGGQAGSGQNGWAAIGQNAPTFAEGIEAAFQEKPQYSSAANNGFSMVDSTLAGGRKSQVGMGGVNTGAALMNTGLQSNNPSLILAGGIAGTAGTLINAGWGIKENEANIKLVNDSIAQKNRAAKSMNNIGNTNELVAASGMMSGASGLSASDLYEGGWFSGNEAEDKGNELLKKERDALNRQNMAYISSADRVDSNQDSMLRSRTYALGGYFGMEPQGPMFDRRPSSMGAIEYEFMSDYLTNKKQQTEQKNQMNNMFAGMPNSMFANGGTILVGKPQDTLFAFGGDMQSNYGDFSTGLTHVDAGGSHEENPNDGVQMGVDQEGVPNLVEENETIWNDYVFSNRITCDETTKKLFHLPKKKDVTYAEVSKKLEKEIQERPNDPISKAGFNAQMEKLEEQQERQKQKMEAERAKAAFEALSPEEQTAVMQQVVQQEAARENLAAQAMTEQNLTGGAQSGAQNIPEEMMGGQPIGDAMGTVTTEQPVMAEGGKLFKEGGDKKKNVGTWKDDKENHWDVFTKPGLRAYIESIKQRLAMAPDDATKDAIRKEAMNELNSLQQSYFSHVLPDAGKEKYDYSEDIKNHQLLFDKLYGNTGFYSTDDNGNVRNLIADAINLPNGAATEDKPEHWADGYNGRRTSIRNFGSTEYGDDKYYKDLVDEFAQLGLTYAPNENWKYGDNRLYALSIPEATAAKATEPKVWDWNTGDWVDKVAEPEGEASGTVNKIDASTVEEENEKQTPKLRPEWMRYTGLVGPAVGLGLMAAGVGKPDYSRLDAALEGAGNAHLADYKPLGNYLTYRPMDIWFEQNRMDANARATDRAILNTGANQGTKMAGLLASGYNNQIADGELYRKALEYNDANRKQVADFNRGTDMFNAEAYNKTSQFNADARNRARQYRAGLALQAATERLNRDAGWYNSLYGNVSGLFRGIGDLGRENAQWNMISRAAADTTNLGDSNTSDIYLKKKKKSQGGKVRRKRGLTY